MGLDMYLNASKYYSNFNRTPEQEKLATELLYANGMHRP